jgi:hypothetical protein
VVEVGMIPVGVVIMAVDQEAVNSNYRQGCTSLSLRYVININRAIFSMSFVLFFFSLTNPSSCIMALALT